MSQQHLNSTKSWFVYGFAVLAYISAISQRTSFGVAGIEATERFHASAQILATFSVVQLIVYAGAQVPVGLLLDKFGPRILITCGALLMSAGQAFLAISVNVPMGLVGRVMVGMGDAMVFVSVLKLLPLWFSGSRIPILTQLTGTFGQLGQLISIFPFHMMLLNVGWSPAFSVMSGFAFATFITTIAFVRNGQSWTGGGQGGHSSRSRIAQALKQPGTRLGFWTHFTTAFMINTFMMTWGYPFLVEGQGLDSSLASGLMSIFVVVAVMLGPMLGALTARRAEHRSNYALGIIGLMLVMWAVVLFWPGQAPLWVLIVLMISVAAGGPASVIGFDFARTFNPPNVLGTATGLVNTGGFIGAFITIYVIGFILDMLNKANGTSGELYNLGSFRIALSVQFVMAAMGIAFMLIERRKARRFLAEQ
ncbi:MFS transporter [Glutamicibacter sp. JL.03c]|uniref:MFS transporter n=1 Tax=Glutamicibacter sp. JL.03c TaxID=2984842 RepID=UPI0021F7373C|nr:MFS transporter [Glutamicibacter sp. JL.03c]UYQ76340.1 MFS transporter [Glutamicibacter sp. JL.03c]